MSETLRDQVAALADDFEDNIDWSSGRSNYGDNEAWESAARQIRALLAATAPTPDEVGLVECCDERYGCTPGAVEQARRARTEATR